MISHKPRYRFVYLSGLLVSLYYAMTVFINSSFLGTRFDQVTIDGLYMISALITISALMMSSRFINAFGNFRLVLLGLTLEAGALVTLALAPNRLAIAVAFITYQALGPLLLFGLDIFFEGALVSLKDAERVRSYYLTAMNLAFVVAPLFVGILVNHGAFNIVYLLSALCVGVLWILVFDLFSKLKPRRLREIGFIDSLKKFWHRKHLTGIFIMDFLLQCFYALMVIFTGPYLHHSVGLSWTAIGIIYTIMLLPFVLFEAPLGKMFDHYHNERDVLIAGFFIMAVCTMLIPLIHSLSILVWASLLFMSRVGASFVEVSAEASFYRRVTDQDAGFISIFRLGSPMAYVIAPLIATFFLPAFSISALYFILAGVLLIGLYIAYTIRF